MEDARYLESIRQLTIEDIQKVRDEYLVWDKVVAAGIVPTGAEHTGNPNH